jgi:hypothetical protein
MIDLAAATDLAVRSTRHLALSARPDAPVVPSRQSTRRGTRARALVAAQLHRIAAALEPRREPASTRPTRAMGASPACR